MMNTPSIGTYPGQWIRVWDDQQDLMRNLLGQHGISVSLHSDGDRIIIDGSGISGLDPNYIVLANNLVTLSKHFVVNGGDDSQILFSTSDGATHPGTKLINDPYQNSFVLQLNGSDRINVGPTLITLNGNVLCGSVTMSSATVANTLTCASLTTNEIDLSMPGLSSHILVNNTTRISFTQLKTQIHNDLEVLGHISGAITNLSEYRKHASSHVQAVGCESNVGLANVSLHDYPTGWGTLLDWGRRYLSKSVQQHSCSE